MRVILTIRLIFVVLDLDEVRVDCGGVEGEGDDGIDGGGLDILGERPSLVCIKKRTEDG